MRFQGNRIIFTGNARRENYILNFGGCVCTLKEVEMLSQIRMKSNMDYGARMG
jgi:hypothetical protein